MGEFVGGTIEKIGLGVITHRRPDGLRALLQSLSEIKVPKGTECVVLIAENDEEKSLAPLISEMEEVLPFPVRYVLEQRRGIPQARNCILDIAAAEGCAYLTFVDDDSVVHQDWLVVLYNALVGRGVDLVGGPNRLQGPTDVALTWQNRLVLRDVRAANAKLMQARMMRVATPQETALEIYTNNWMVRLDAQQKLGVRFDEALRFTGGSDRKFFLDFVRGGGRSAWSSDARVFEIWPPERLTFAYLFRRIRDQQMMRLICDDSVPSASTAMAGLITGAVWALWLVLQAPLTRFRTVPTAVRRLAVAVAQFRVAHGKESALYAPEVDA
ncbi:MAG: glycosyltransferase family A protein [Pseudomonadota bacterium]